MDIKRILTTVIGLPVVVAIMVLGTPQIISFVTMIIAIIAMNEYFNVVSKICKPIKWVGYVSTIIIFLVGILSTEIINMIIIYLIPVMLLILFLHVVLTEMKYTFKDVAYALLGICYITGFLMFLALMTKLEKGNFLLIYTVLVAWITDIFAYLVGMYLGKHHFSKISPKKTIEGCIAGAVFSVIFSVIYVLILNKIGVTNINSSLYIYIGGITLILSIISQIGDFVASSIKRFADTKDYGNLLPGHGGMLDRIDSLIFIAPFVYMIMNLIQII